MTRGKTAAVVWKSHWIQENVVILNLLAVIFWQLFREEDSQLKRVMQKSEILVNGSFLKLQEIVKEENWVGGNKERLQCCSVHT